MTASTLGAANGISQLVNHLPGLVEKKDGGGTDWKGALQVRLTEAGRQRCEQLRPPAPDPVPPADDEVRKMLRDYREELADSQQLANFAQEHLGGNRLFDDPWPVVVARCWPEPIKVEVDGVVIGTLNFTPATQEPENPPPAAAPATSRQQPRRTSRAKRHKGSA